MSTLKFKSGIITIPLVIILLISFGVLAMSKSIVNSQASVSTAIDSRYQNPTISLSSVIDPVQLWEKYENALYSYTLKYPKQWPASKSKAEKGDLDTYSRFLSNRVILKVRVLSKYEFPEESKLASAGKNDYYFLPRQTNLRSAAVTHGKYFYLIELSEDNYFADGKEFDSVFLNVLKTFEFTKP